MMSEAALEEVSVLSSIYCGDGEFQLVWHSDRDGLVVQINCTIGADRGLMLSVVFSLHPDYPACPPDVSVSSTGLSRTQCHSIRQKLLDRAAALPPEPMVHQLVEYLQECVQLTQDHRADNAGVKEKEKEEEWTAVLLLDHIRSQNRYIGLLERWSHQLQLAGRLLLGHKILLILQGSRRDIKEFCHRLKTVKVDVDSLGKKCKERMMKVLIETPSSSSQQGFQGFVVKVYQSLPELTGNFQELNMTEFYQQMLPTLRD
ncbi:RWD domain-containing protein 3 [Xenentodon cancila]